LKAALAMLALILEASRRTYEARLSALEARERDATVKEAEVNRLLEDLEERRREKWRGELQAAREFVRSLKEDGRRLLARVEERAASRRDFAAFVDRAIETIDTRQAELSPAEPTLAGPLRPGDTVELAGGGFRGELASVEGDRAWIRRGTMRVEVRSSQLCRVAPAATPAASSVRVETAREAPGTEVTLIGLRAKEALAKLEGFLDRATVAGHASVRIVHGIGSGALRRAVQEYLDVSPYCAGYRDGESGEGGTGVTVAELGR